MSRVSSFPIVIFLLLASSSPSRAMAEEQDKHAGGEEVAAAAVHIVYVEHPEGEDPKAFHLRTLTAVVGSEEAAKETMLYSYTHAASGFSAKLTPTQVEEMSRQPGVLQVQPSRALHLHSGPQGGGVGVSRLGHV